MNASTRVGAREDDPVEAAGAARTPRRAARSPPAAAMRIIGASIASAPSASSRSTSSAACSRGRVTRMRLPKSGRASNQRRCSRSAATRPTTRIAGRRSSAARTRLGQLAERAGDRLLRRQRAVVDERRRRRRPAGRATSSASSMLRQLLRARVADDRAVEPRQARPVDRRARLALVLVAADERERVAAARIGDRNARVARHARCRPECPGTTSNRTPCSCRNSASAPPRSNTNGSPHFSRATVLPSRAFSASR